MKPLPALVLLLSAACVARAEVIWQVLDDCASPGADGKPAGWDVVAVGAEAQLAHVAGNTPGLRLTYRYTADDGVIYLLRRARLRTAPRRFEVTANGHNGRLHLGVLVRDAVDDELYEYRSPLGLDDDNWQALDVPLVAFVTKDGEGNGQIDPLPGGGGVRIEGLAVRRPTGAPAEGSLELAQVRVSVDVEPAQQAMIDALSARYDGVYLDGEAPAPELLINSLDFGPSPVRVEYAIVDALGRDCGRGNDEVQARGERLTRVRCNFAPPAPRGHFTLTATATIGESTRNATLRFCVLPPTPDDGARLLGVTLTPRPGALQPWLDRVTLAMLQRAGAGFVRVELAWPEVVPGRGQFDAARLQPFAELARGAGLKLLVAVGAPSRWPAGARMQVEPAEFAALAGRLRERLGDGLACIEVWPGADAPRSWPPEPRPYGFRAMLEACLGALGETRPRVVSGGLGAFSPGFFATLLTRQPYPCDALTLTTPSPRQAPPLESGALPSSYLAGQLTAYRVWQKETGRQRLAVGLGPVGVRTSPIEESKLAQAAELARLAALARGHGGSLVWHTARDGQGEEERYGLIRGDLQPKESLATFAAAAALSHGAKPLGATVVTGGEGFVLAAGGGFVACAWGRGELRLQGAVEVRDAWGNPVRGATLGEAPLWLTGAGVATSLPLAR